MNGGIVTEYHRILIQLRKISAFEGGTDRSATTCRVVIEVGKSKETLTSRSRIVECFFTTFQVLPCSGRMQESSWPAKLFSPRDAGMYHVLNVPATCSLRVYRYGDGRTSNASDDLPTYLYFYFTWTMALSVYLPYDFEPPDESGHPR